jgi:GNAT superfamily N-acetyltransferase
MMTNAAVRAGLHDEQELAALAEHIERRAWRDLVAAAPQWLRRTTGVAVDEVGGAMLLAAPGLNHLLFNRVIGLGEQAAATPELIAEIMGRYWDLSIERYWVHVGPYARPARLGRMLQEQGLAPYRRSWVKLIRPAQRAAPASGEAVVREAAADDAIAVASILGAGFDLPQAAAEIFGQLIGRQGWRVYVAEIDGEIAGAAGLFVEADAAYLPFAATRPEFRSRGVQRALIAARIDAAADADAHWIASETGFPLTADEANPSYHNLLGCDFRPIAIRDNYALPGTAWG